MFTEQLNFAVVQTELDDVFKQEFDYDSGEPEIATARTAELFKVVPTTMAAYITDTFAGSPLFPIVGEVQTVPLSTPRVTNKQTTLVKDFAEGIELSKDLFDDEIVGFRLSSVFLSFAL